VHGSLTPDAGPGHFDTTGAQMRTVRWLREMAVSTDLLTVIGGIVDDFGSDFLRARIRRVFLSSHL